MMVKEGESAADFGYLSSRGEATFVSIPQEPGRPFCYGVQMTIDATVNCSVPSLKREFVYQWAWNVDSKPSSCSLPLWDKKKDLGGQRFQLEMELRCNPGDELISLAELAKRLRNGDRTAETLATLDELAQKLFALSQAMQKHNVSLGLIDPRNVFYFERIDATDTGPQLQLLLPDAFLLPGDSGVPQWIKLRDDYDFIWRAEYLDELRSSGDLGAARRDFLDRQSSPATFTSLSDLRCLARMFACVLTGKEMEQIPVDSALKGDVWDVFRRLLNEKPEADIDVCREIEIPGNKLSDALDPKPPEPPRKRRGLGVGRWAALLLVLTAAFLVVYRQRDEIWPPPAPASPIYFACPDCPNSSRLHDHFRVAQLPLIQEFGKGYLSPGDTDVWGDETPTAVDEVLLVDMKLLNSQSANLGQQLDVIESAFKLVAGEASSAEKQCLRLEAGRCQQALIIHFGVLYPRLDTTGPVSAKSLMNEMLSLCTRLDSILSHEFVNDPADTSIVKSLESNPLFEQKKCRQYYSMAARFKDLKQAEGFVTSVDSWVNKTPPK